MNKEIDFNYIEVFENTTGKFYIINKEDRMSMWILRGDHEKHVKDAIESSENKDAFAIDVGACVGVHTITMSKHFKNVIAYEPVSSTFEMLCKNIELNNIKNVFPIKAAIGSYNSTINAPFVNPITTKNMGGSKMSEVKSNKNEVVRLATLDSEWIEMGRPHIAFIKIDIEGMEVDGLTGAIETIRTCHPIIAVEVQPENVSRVFDILGKCKYKTNLMHGYDYICKYESESIIGTEVYDQKNFRG